MIKLNLLFTLSYLNSNFRPTLGDLNSTLSPEVLTPTCNNYYLPEHYTFNKSCKLRVILGIAALSTCSTCTFSKITFQHEYQVL